MSEDSSPAPVPFDIQPLAELIRLMEEHDLTEVDLHRGDQRCRLRRGTQQTAVYAPAPQYMPAPAAISPSTATAGAASAAPAAEARPDNTRPIKSPTVGTFYAAASPDDEPFAKVGTRVSADTVVCLVEAMKVYNEVKAEVAGVVTEVCVSNGDAVEYGQVLFRVQPG